MSKKQCPCCLRKRVGPIHTWRRWSAYHIKELNYMHSCIHCAREDDRNLAYDWNEYYSSQGYGESTYQIEQRIKRDYRQPKDYVK